CAAPPPGRRGLLYLTAEFPDPLPPAVISRVTGVAAPGGEEVRFRELAQATIRGFFTFGDPAARERGGEAFAELAEWGRQVANDRRRAPREDMITAAVRARDRGDAMSDDEIVILVAGLLGAGSETTAVGGLISMLALLARPDVLAA